MCVCFIFVCFVEENRLNIWMVFHFWLSCCHAQIWRKCYLQCLYKFSEAHCWDGSRIKHELLKYDSPAELDGFLQQPKHEGRVTDVQKSSKGF